VYHYRVGHVAFQGQGWVRPGIFRLLLTHTILAVVIVPMILVYPSPAPGWKDLTGIGLLHGGRCRFVYVSVTGVIVYLMLYQVYTAQNPADFPNKTMF